MLRKKTQDYTTLIDIRVKCIYPVYQLCQLQNIVADKVTVKLDPGSSPNSQCEVNSACVGLQNTHTLHPTTSTWSTFVLAYLNKPTAMMRIFFTPACFIHSSRRGKKVQHWSTSFFFSPTWAYPGKISSRIYQLMFTFDSLLQVWEAKAPKLISGHKVKSSRCVIIFKQTSYNYELEDKWAGNLLVELLGRDAAILIFGNESRGLDGFESQCSAQLFGETIFFCLLFPGTKTSLCCWPQWSAVH